MVSLFVLVVIEKEDGREALNRGGLKEEIVGWGMLTKELW